LEHCTTNRFSRVFPSPQFAARIVENAYFTGGGGVKLFTGEFTGQSRQATMATNKKDRNASPADTENGEAINRVLQAEHAAQQAVARCEHRAQGVLHSAQAQVQRINQRADERISWVEMRCAQWLSEQSRRLAQEVAVQADSAGGTPASALTSLVDALAERLTTGADKAST
jgi:hypothetical protein